MQNQRYLMRKYTYITHVYNIAVKNYRAMHRHQAFSIIRIITSSTYHKYCLVPADFLVHVFKHHYKPFSISKLLKSSSLTLFSTIRIVTSSKHHQNCSLLFSINRVKNFCCSTRKLTAIEFYLLVLPCYAS